MWTTNSVEETHLGHFSCDDETKRKRETAAWFDICLGFILDEGRKLNRSPIDLHQPEVFEKANTKAN